MSLELTVGDSAPTLTGHVNADLTAATLEVHILKPDGAIINRARSVVGAATEGNWSLALIAGDLSVPGRYFVEVQVTFSGPKIQTFRKDPDETGIRAWFNVEPQIA
jgi:hypothetical protein